MFNVCDGNPRMPFISDEKLKELREKLSSIDPANEPEPHWVQADHNPDCDCYHCRRINQVAAELRAESEKLRNDLMAQITLTAAEIRSEVKDD